LPPGVAAIIELTADRQTYDSQRQIFTAEGRVLMRFQGALLDTDRLQVNLANRLAVAEGSVALTRGNQVLRGQRLEYNFVQGSGTVLKATGTLFLPSTSTDLLIPLGNDISAESTVGRPTSDRISAAQPVQGVTSSGGISTSIGVGRDVNRIPAPCPQEERSAGYATSRSGGLYPQKNRSPPISSSPTTPSRHQNWFSKPIELR
jgi:hypothetical protein